MAGHRSRSAERRSPRAVIQHVYEKYGRLGRGDDRQRHHLPRPQRRARSRQGARASTLAQIDRLAKVLHHFEYVDTGRLVACGSSSSVGLDLNTDRVRHVRAALARDAGPAAPPRPAFRRHGDLPGPARCGGAARKRQHARPRRRAVGQGRLRRHGDRQGRSARPRDDGGASGHARAGKRRRRTQRTPRTPRKRLLGELRELAFQRPWWISPTCRKTIPRSTRCCRRPTRLACSRWNRARRWRRCRG